MFEHPSVSVSRLDPQGLISIPFPDSKLDHAYAHFNRDSIAGKMHYRFTYSRQSNSQRKGNTGSTRYISTEQIQPPPFAHGFLPDYLADFRELEHAVLALSGGSRLRDVKVNEHAFGGNTLFISEDILLPGELTKEELARLLSPPNTLDVKIDAHFTNVKRGDVKNAFRAGFRKKTLAEKIFHMTYQ